MHRRVAVVSGKGGTGKSTVCAGLGRALAHEGKRVLLIDLDAGMRCLDLMLGVADRLVFDLSDVLSGKPLSEVVLAVSDLPCLHLLAAPAEERALDPIALDALLAELEPQYDFVFLDFAAGSVVDKMAGLPADTSVLIVATPDEIAIRDAGLVRASLAGVFDARLLLNRFSCQQLWQAQFRSLDALMDACGLPLAGVVPFDPLLLSKKYSRRSPAAKAFRRISQRLQGKAAELPNLKRF